MPALPKEMVPAMLATGASSRLPDPVAPRFRAHDAVIARNLNPVGHTRLPRYIKGKRGTIRFDHGVFAFPDTAAHGLGHKAQHVYSVRFAARELWGEEASPHDSVYIDLFDDYLDLDPAGSAAAPSSAGGAQVRPAGRSSRRSVRPPRGRGKSRKPRRPGVRLQKAAAAPAAPARASRKAAAKKGKKRKPVATPKAARKKTGASAAAKGRGVVAKKKPRRVAR